MLDRALEVYAEVGFRGMSLRTVAEGIGVTHAAVRHYFASVEDLLMAVLQRADERALAGLDVSGVTAAEDASLELASVSRGVPGLIALYLTMAARAVEASEPGMRDFFAERYRQVRAFARMVLQTARARDGVRGDIDLDVAAALLVVACDGLSTQWLLDPEQDMAPGLRLLDHLLRPAAPGHEQG